MLAQTTRIGESVSHGQRMEIAVHESMRQLLEDEISSKDEPLAVGWRGMYPSSIHRGTVSVVDSDGREVLSVGATSQPVFLRSSAKPFQVLPALLSGGIDRYGVTDRELAVLCASHSGELRHREAVLSVLRKIDLPEEALQCGVHPPLNENSAKALWSSGQEPTASCHNCSGAHAGMLLACKAMGWPSEAYGSVGHPLQQLVLRILASFAGLPADSVTTAIDNCAVPAFRMPLMHAAQAYARLAAGTGVPIEYAEAAHRVVDAMTANPEMVGGEDRFDTALMEAAGGSMVAKSGAEAFQGIGVRASGLGVAIKVRDGTSRAVSPVSISVLRHLGALDSAQIKSLRKYAAPNVYSHLGEIVGRVEAIVQPDPAQ